MNVLFSRQDQVFSRAVRTCRSHVGETTLSMFIKLCFLAGNLLKNTTRNPFEVSATGSFMIKINPYCVVCFFIPLFLLLLLLPLSWVYNFFFYSKNNQNEKLLSKYVLELAPKSYTAFCLRIFLNPDRLTCSCEMPI